jgi:hypothetical protein
MACGTTLGSVVLEARLAKTSPEVSLEENEIIGTQIPIFEICPSSFAKATADRSGRNRHVE